MSRIIWWCCCSTERILCASEGCERPTEGQMVSGPKLTPNIYPLSTPNYNQTLCLCMCVSLGVCACLFVRCVCLCGVSVWCVSVCVVCLFVGCLCG